MTIQPSDLPAAGRSTSSRTLVRIKSELLASGLSPTKTFLSRYGKPYLEKRRAYGNPDDLIYRSIVVPQELYLMPARIICSVNLRSQSPWSLDFDDEHGFHVHRGGADAIRVDFPMRPDFYDMTLRSGEALIKYATLYGGGSLGIFVYGRCALVDMGKACQYCSIAPNRGHVGDDFAQVIKASEVRESVALALGDANAPISQVMLNGGNFTDLDKGFAYYAQLVKAAREAIDASGRDVELHLIVFPPNDVSLFNALKGLDVCVAMNTEVFDPALFARHCPGKVAIGGQAHLFRGMEAAAKTLGEGAVYSIFVGGLEPVSSMRAGLWAVADLGVTPVVNVFHADPQTPLASHPVACASTIMEMGAALEEVYSEHAFMKPFYSHCGRNALDTEAHARLFCDPSGQG